MASLPSGYTKLDYIESSGTQYIDTGVSSFGTQRTRVILDVDWLSGLGCYFGCFSSGLRWFVEALQPTKIYSGYLDEGKSADIATVIGRYTVDKNGISTNVNGVKIQHASAGSSTSKSIYLLACNGSSGVSGIADAARIYSCKISSSSGLIRQFVPCKNSSGEVGLYDKVNDVFYGNAGTGVFIAGPEVPISGSGGGGKHKTLIAGTSYGIKSGRTLIGGTGYDIKKGRTLIGGTGYDIKLATPLAELPEGSIIKLNEDDAPVEFYIAKHDYESNLNGAGRTLLVRKDCYASYNLANYSSPSNYFPNTSIYKVLNGTYKVKLDAAVRIAMGTTSFKTVQTYTTQGSAGVFTHGRMTTVSAAVFALSKTEISNILSYNLSEGTQLPISDTLKIALFNGEAVNWITRTSIEMNSICVITSSGSVSTIYYHQNSDNYYMRPVFTLPETMEVDGDFNLIAA